MEKRGAEVVAYDLSANDEWDFVPFEGINQGSKNKSDECLSRLNKAWWLGHRLMKSKTRVVYGSVYNIPKTIGPVQISTFGCILLHLRDPFLALQKASALTTETMIITDLVPVTIKDQICSRLPVMGKLWNVWKIFNKYSKPHLIFLPDADKGEPLETWWWLPPDLVCQYLKILGFPKIRISYHKQKFGNSTPRLYTIVGSRV